MYKPSIQSLIKRDGGNCHYCGCNLFVAKNAYDNRRKVATREHIVPRSFGGSWAPHNIVLACRDCNEQRANEYFYCGCSFCLTAYEKNVDDKFFAIVRFNNTVIRKTKRNEWKLIWHGSMFYYSTWSEAMDALYEKEMAYYATSQNR